MVGLGGHLESSPRLGRSLTFDHEVTADDFTMSGAISYFFHEDDIPNMNELNFRRADELIDLAHLQALGLISVLWGSVKTPKHRHFAIIGRLLPLGYDFLEACQGTDDA